jgi:hypothetical protein
MFHQLETNGGIYLMGDYGKVFYRNNTMTDWVLYDAGLPMALNGEISRLKPFYKTQKLRMASNAGIWEVDFYENSTTTLVQPKGDSILVLRVKALIYKGLRMDCTLFQQWMKED